MWAFLKENTGETFVYDHFGVPHGLWHAIDATEGEQAASKATSSASHGP
jgi:hypothetical protein